MGVKHCAWGTCTSDSRDKEKEHMRNVKFYSFPKPDLQNDFCEKTIRCRNWIKACARPHSQLNLQKIEQDYKKYRYYYVVCSKHFPDGKPTDQYPDPVPADPSSKIAKTPKRKAPCRGKDDSSTKKQKTSSSFNHWDASYNRQDTRFNHRGAKCSSLQQIVIDIKYRQCRQN